MESDDRMSKRVGLMLLVGAFVITTALGSIVMAAHTHRKLDPEKATAHIVSSFNVSKEEVQNLNSKGYTYRDIGKAAFLANIAGKSLTEVISLKQTNNTWRDVAGQVGVTKEQMKAERSKVFSERLAKRYNVNAAELRTLHDQGVPYHGLAKASYLAQQAHKPVSEVTALKDKENTWLDVSNKLGLNEDQTKQEFAKRHKMCRHHKKAGEHPQQQSTQQ